MVGGSVTRNYIYFLVSRDLLEVVSRPTIIDELVSVGATHAGAAGSQSGKKQDEHASARSANHIVVMKVDSTKEEEEHSVLLSQLVTTPKLENSKRSNQHHKNGEKPNRKKPTTKGNIAMEGQEPIRDTQRRKKERGQKTPNTATN